MNELPPVVFRPPDAEGSEYAVIIDDGVEAVWLRDLCQREAQKHHTRASEATQRAALDLNMQKYECFAKYADRFEHIRKEVVERIVASLEKGESDGNSS